jgi:hypothetical protein
VRVLDGLADGDEQLQTLPRRELVGVAVLRDRHPVNQLHHEVRPARLSCPRVEHPGDVLVVHHRQRLPLGLEPGHDLPRVHSRLEYLQGDPAAHRLRLLGHEDQTEAAFADLLQQLVRADHRTGTFAYWLFIDGDDLAGGRRLQEAAGGSLDTQQGFHPLSQTGVTGASLIQVSRPGRHGRHVNLFAGLLQDARTGSSFYAKGVGSRRGQTGGRILLPAEAVEGLSCSGSFPYRTLERAVLALLPELNPADVLRTARPDPTAALEAELAWTRDKLAEIKAQLLRGDVAVLADAARHLEATAEDLEHQLDQAKQAQARPVADAWQELGEVAGQGEAELPVPGGILPSIMFPPELTRCFLGGRRAVLPAVDDAEDQEGFRLKLRSVLRRIIKRVDLLVTTDGAERLAVVQLQLVGDKRLAAARAHLPDDKLAWAIHIQHRPPRANANGRRPGRWWAWWGVAQDLSTAKGRAKALAALRELRVRDGDLFREGVGAVTEELP